MAEFTHVIVALALASLAVRPHHVPGHHAAPRVCLSAPGGISHRPMGAGSLAWMETLAFVPACVRN